MKKFKFSLDKMRNYRDQLLDEEKNRLAQLKQIQFGIEQKIHELEFSFYELSQEMKTEQEKGTYISKLRTYDSQLTNVRHQLNQLSLDLSKAQENVDRQMTVVVSASQEVSKLDKLEEKQLEEYQKDVAKAEEALIDEFVSSDSIRKQIS